MSATSDGNAPPPLPASPPQQGARALSQGRARLLERLAAAKPHGGVGPHGGL